MKRAPHRFAHAAALFLAALLSTLLVSSRAVAGPTVVLWHAYRGAEQQALEIVLARFRSDHPEATVETLAVPFDAYASKLEAAIPHGHGPDVFLDAHERLGDYRDKSLVSPLDDEVLDRSAYDESAISAVTLEGKAYALPLALK